MSDDIAVDDMELQAELEAVNSETGKEIIRLLRKIEENTRS